jgi:hypothetical protein
MPFAFFDFAWTAYLVVIVILLIGVVVLIRLMLAATRALNAYTEHRKLRTALILDPDTSVHDSRIG